MTRDLPLQSLAAVSKANTTDMQPLMSKLDTLLRSLLADFSTDNAGKLPDAAHISCFHAEALCVSIFHFICCACREITFFGLERYKVQGSLGARKDKR